MKFCGKEKISVVVIIYNVEAYLAECVSSIRNQTYENLEIILVDDGSMDKSGEICDAFLQEDKRIKVIHKDNGGLVSARQAGMEVVTGEYVAFVDGDDWIDQDMYERLYLEAKLYDAEIVLSGIVREFPDKRRCDLNAVPVGFYDKQELEKDIYPHMMYNMETRSCLIDPSLCNKLFWVDVIRPVLSQVDKKIFYLGEDAATTFPCLLKAKSMYVTDFCMYHHRIVAQKDDFTYKRERVYERLLAFYRNLQKNFSNTAYAEIMKQQLNGYFLHLLTVITREAIDLDIQIFFQYLIDYKEILVPENKRMTYQLPMQELKEYKNIVLYGAGKVGRDYYEQLKGTGIHVVLWTDKQYAVLANSGLPVGCIEDIKKFHFDAIVLAAKRENMAENMKKELVDRGIAENIIKWVKPIENT